MKTEFGRFVKEIRFKEKENLRQMAEHLKVSSSFLSAVEVGKKAVPKDWVEKISLIYSLNIKEQDELKNCIDKDSGKVIINIENMETEKRDVLMLFARTINTADQKTLAELKEMLNKCKKNIL
ncbi:MAG: helix-turn-helix transcriptional regulator [Bacilli bacterium]